MKYNFEKKKKKTLSTTLIIIMIYEFFGALKHHIRVISEGSCDTEDWRNDAEHSALITGYILKDIQIEKLF